MDSGKISVRRFFLNLGLLGIFISMVSAGMTFYENKTFYAAVEGTVKEIRVNKKTDNYTEYEPMVEYTYNGKTYLDYGFYAKGQNYTETTSMQVGDSATYYIEKNYPKSLTMPNEYWDTLLMLVPSLILTAVCCKAFKGYKQDFLVRYKPFVIVTVSVQALCTAIMPPVYYHIETVERGGFMPGLDALGDLLGLIAVLALISLGLIIMWIAATVRYVKSRRSA